MAVLKAVAELTLNGNGFAAGLQTANRQLSSFATAAGSVLKSRLGGFAGLFGGAAATAAARGVVGYADALGKLSKQSGIAQADLQKLGFAADMTDSSLEEMTASIKKLGLSQVEARNGNQDLVQLFQKYGVSIDDLKSKRPEELFWKIADRLDGVRVNAQISADMMDLMGKSADKVLPAMVDGLAKAAREAERLKLILSDSDLAQLQNLDDQVTMAKARSRPAVAGALTAGLDIWNKIHNFGMRLPAWMGGIGAMVSQVLGAQSAVSDMKHASERRSGTPSRADAIKQGYATWEVDPRFRGLKARNYDVTMQEPRRITMGGLMPDVPEVNGWQRLGAAVRTRDFAKTRGMQTAKLESIGEKQLNQLQLIKDSIRNLGGKTKTDVQF